MKLLKNIAMALTVILVILYAVSCSPSAKSAVLFATPEEPFSAKVLFDSESEAAQEAAVEFKAQIAELSLGNITAVYPATLMKDDIEVIFGVSDRTASIKANELLESNGAYESEDYYWSFACMDGKLAVIANSKLAYSIALRTLFEEYVQDGSFAVLDGLAICDKLSLADYEAQFDLPKGESLDESVLLESAPLPDLGDAYDMGQGSSLYILPDSEIWEYTELRESLRESGFTYYTGNRIGDNVFATYISKTQIVHTMFFYNKNEIRVAVDNRTDGGFSLAGLESENTYERTGESIMTLVDIEPADYDGGLSMIFKLADGRFFIIDSGILGRKSASGTSAGWIYATLLAHADDPDNITVATWLLTHTHSDHIGGLYDMANGYYLSDGATHPLAPENITEKIKIERIIYNEPKNDGEYSYDGWMDTITSAFDVKNVVKAHPGQQFFIADLTLTVYGSQDLVIDQKAKIENVNEFSVVTMIDFNGKRLLALADAFPKQNAQIAKIYKTELKADIIQVAHHGYADTGAKSVNNYCNPDIVLWPNSEEGMAKYTVLTREQNAIFLTKENYAPHGGNIDFDSNWNASEPYSVLDLIPVCSCGCEKKSAMDTAERGVAAE